MYKKPIAKMSEGMLVPNTTTKVAASAMPGKDMTTSRTRMMTSETHLRETAARAPMMEPHTESEGGRAQADDERIACAVHHAGQDVAALIVGAEDELGIGSLTCREDFQRIVRRDEVRERRDEHDKGKDDQGNTSADGHGLPAAEAHLARVRFHFLREVFHEVEPYRYTVLIRGSIRI